MEPIRLNEFLNYHFISALALAPDGAHAAFALSQSNDQNGYDSNLWLLSLKEERAFQFTASGKEKSFIWEDRETLLFPSGRKDEPHGTVFFRQRIGGGEATEAFRLPVKVSAFQGIGKGRYLITAPYQQNLPDPLDFEGEERNVVYKAMEAEEDYEVLDELPFWANGKGFTNKRRSRLYLYDETTDKLSAISPPLMNVEGITVAEDLSRVLFFGCEFDSVCDQTAAVHELNLEDLSDKVLLPSGRLHVDNAFYLDNAIILLATDQKRYGTSENTALYRLQPENNGYELILDPDMSFGNSVGTDSRLWGGISAKTSGNALYTIVTEQNASRLYVFRGGTLLPLTASKGAVDSFDVQGDRILFVGMRGMGLEEIYALDVRTGKEKRLTNINATLRNRYVGEPEKLSFTNSDGLSIDGWVIRPKDYDPGKTYPAILDIHGGPKTVYGEVFVHEMQHWASEGYFVLFCNPRGSDGRGNAFADLRGKYGTIDYRDIMEFTDEVLRRYPAIDPARLGVAGGSYGGFMVNWIIGHTDRFAAAVSQRSIANWISKTLTTDIGYYHNMDQMAATPWNGANRMWDFSPLKYADQIRTPTLFIHSNEDYRCWMAEGLQMFTALKLHGVPARLCLFKGENHELSRSGKPQHRVRRLQEMTEWFNQYLKA